MKKVFNSIIISIIDLPIFTPELAQLKDKELKKDSKVKENNDMEDDASEKDEDDDIDEDGEKKV